MKNSTCIFIFVLTCLFTGVHAQTLSPKVIPTNGGTSDAGGVSLSFTFGETFNTSLINGSTILTQGEQQPEIDLVTGTASASVFCSGNSFTLNYTATGLYGVGNIFTAQLSNAAGSFASPVSIGSTGSTTSGTINCVIPPTTPAGNNYLVRVVSSLPEFIGKISTTILTISNAPPAGTVHIASAPSAGCVGSTDQVSVNPVPGATFYNWSSNQNGILFNGNPSPYQSSSPVVTISYSSLPQAGASGWSVCTFAGNACGNSNTICTWIRSVVSSPSSITGSVINCPGTTAIPYSTSTVAGASNYIWTGSAGITINGSGQNITVDFSTAFNSGTLCVHAQTSCGYNSQNRCITISKTTAVPGIITGASYVCPNGTSAYSVAAVTGSVSYNWTCSVPGSVLTPAGNNCSVLFPANIPAGSTVSVSALSSCGNASTVRSKGIASGLPNTPGNISGLISGQCGQSGVSYSVSPVNLATGYLWTVSGGATINGPNNLSGVSIDFPASFTTATITVHATNSCGTGYARSLTASGSPSMPPAITGNVTACNGSFESYSTAGSAGAASYTWTVPAGASIIGPATGSSILVHWGSSGGNITVKAENNCGISAQRVLAIAITCRQSQIETGNVAFNAEVYPNPATGKIYLSFLSASTDDFHFEITNALGQTMISKSDVAATGINISEIDVTGLSKGIYNFVLMDKNRTERKRFVIESHK